MTREIATLALMICTYRRPKFFARCIQSVAALDVPPGFGLTVAIADNNPASERDGYVGRALADLPFAFVYGHQPVPGYSNARNLAIELALTTPGEVFAFVDDDLVLAPDWLSGQIRSYRELDCAAVGGAVIGTQKVPPHGSRQRHSSMANFSFLRELVEPVPPAGAGLGLRFDPARNLTGNEDLAFSAAAVDAGRPIMISHWSSVLDPTTSEADAARADRENRAAVTAAMTRNRIVALREARDYPRLALASLASLHSVLKAAGLSLEAAVRRAAGNAVGAKDKAISARKEWGKFRAVLAGWRGGVVARQDVRRGE